MNLISKLWDKAVSTEDTDVVIATTCRNAEDSSYEYLKVKDRDKVRMARIRREVNEVHIPTIKNQLEVRSISTYYRRRITRLFGVAIFDMPVMENEKMYADGKKEIVEVEY